MKLCSKILFISALLLTVFALQAAPGEVLRCEKTYPQHLQGVDCDERFIYWSFSDTLVKTDWQGKEIQAAQVPYHHGDMCLKNGKIFVAVNFGHFNKPSGGAENFIYVYNASDLKKIAAYPVPEVTFGAGAITPAPEGFAVTGGLPADPAAYPANRVYLYTSDFRFIREARVAPWTLSGIQVIQSLPDGWLLAGHRNRVIVCDKNFKFRSDEAFDATHGIMRHPRTGKLYRAVSTLIKGRGWQAVIYQMPIKLKR